MALPWDLIYFVSRCFFLQTLSLHNFHESDWLIKPADQVLQVMSVPDDLVRIRGSVLEDLNEVVIGDIGWVGSLPKMLIFHWCQRPLELKVREMNLAYDSWRCDVPPLSTLVLHGIQHG